MESENKTNSLLGKIAILIIVAGVGGYILMKDKNTEPLNEPVESENVDTEASLNIDSKTDVETIGSEMDSFDTNFDDMNAEDLDI